MLCRRERYLSLYVLLAPSRVVREISIYYNCDYILKLKNLISLLYTLYLAIYFYTEYNLLGIYNYFMLKASWKKTPPTEAGKDKPVDGDVAILKAPKLSV